MLDAAAATKINKAQSASPGLFPVRQIGTKRRNMIMGYNAGTDFRAGMSILPWMEALGDA